MPNITTNHAITYTNLRWPVILKWMFVWMFDLFFQGDPTAPKFFFISLCHGLDELNSKKYGNNCTKDGGAGVCLVRNQKVSTALGLYKNRAMTYYKDEGMLILTYCSKNCSFKGTS